MLTVTLAISGTLPLPGSPGRWICKCEGTLKVESSQSSLPWNLPSVTPHHGNMPGLVHVWCLKHVQGTRKALGSLRGKTDFHQVIV